MSEPAMQPAASPPPAPLLTTASGIVLVIGALYFGQDIFIPFALAALLAFALTPIVDWFRRIKFPRIVAVITAVALAFILIAGIAYVVGTQLVQLANNLPTYQTTIQQKIRSLQSSAPGGGVVDRVTTTIQDLSREFSDPKPGASTPPTSDARAGPSEREPIPVRIEQGQAQPLQVIRTIVGPLLAPLATAGIVVVFVIFVLLEREDLRDRFIKLVGAGDLQKSTQALNDAAARVSRYLLMQLIVNLTYGVPIGVALYFIGVPNAVLWGLLAAVLRFIPYLGPFLAALFPLALAIAVDPGWSMLFWVAALFLTAELISNNVVEPWLYGASTGLSSLAIITAAIFWTTLWGPVGLFLATPLTVCVVVIGRYVPHLEFLGVLLGNDPVLAPEERFYQRLLAGNLEEAVDLAETYVDEHSSREFYERIGLPALRLAENDRQRSVSDMTYRRQVAETATCVVREIEDHVREKDRSSDEAAEAEPQQPAPASRVLCIAGRTELDRAASEMVAEVLGERGIRAKVMPPITVTQDALSQLDLTGVEVVCLSYLHAQPQVYARYVSRRIKRRAPSVKLLVCLWNTPSNVANLDELKTHMTADSTAVSLEATIQQIETWIAHPLQAHDRTSQSPEHEEERLALLQELDLASSRNGRFDEITREVSQAFDVPIALVSIVGGERQLAAGEVDGTGEHALSREARQEASIDEYVTMADEILVVDDITKDPRFADNPMLLEKGVRFYAGAPLRASNGTVLGALCVIDTKPRSFSEEERVRLQRFADDLINEIEDQRPDVASME